MKKIALLGLVAVMVTVAACDPSTNILNPDSTLSRNGALSITDIFTRVRTLGLNSRGSFGSLFNRSAMMDRVQYNHVQARGAEDSDSTHCDDEEYEEWDDWETCATVTEVDNGDGSYTFTMDWGEEGCYDDEEGEKIFGKIEETIFEDEDGSFSATITYTNFGGEGWVINGTETWSGTETFTEDGEESGSVEFTENLVIVEEGETITLEGSGKESWNKDGFTIDNAKYTYTVDGPEGNEVFSSEVTSPLFYSFACEEVGDIWVFVSGTEVETWNEGSLTIDFGDGTCDNIITVTEGDETITIDLDEEWEDDEEDDDGDDEDGEDDDDDSDG
ncbi:MAG TPA: hypothetical protein DCR93_24965 [Cytophagales bacterium]|nr:hypothetical protein [Cytophagales bacterium]HAP62609.1 hypothetical protein [Cytophagales bacterium]